MGPGTRSTENNGRSISKRQGNRRSIQLQIKLQEKISSQLAGALVVNSEIQQPRDIVIQGTIVGKCQKTGETRIKTDNIPKIILGWQLKARLAVETRADLKTWISNKIPAYQDNAAEFNVYGFKTKLIKYKNKKNIFRNSNTPKIVEAHTEKNGTTQKKPTQLHTTKSNDQK